MSNIKINFSDLSNLKNTSFDQIDKNLKVNSIDDLIKFIEKYEQISDEYLGFERGSGVISNQNYILRRFNDSVSKNEFQSLVANQRVFLGNRILAFKELILAENKNIDQDKLMKVFSQYNSKLDEISSNQEKIFNLEKELKKFKTSLDTDLNLIAKKTFKIKNFKNKMKYAINFIMFNFEKKIIITETSDSSGLKLFSIENPHPPFPKENNMIFEFENQEWYLKLEDFQKNLIRNYKGQIFSNQHVIPRDLNNIKGLRNAFLRQDFLIDKNGGQISYSENFHMASPVVKIKKNPELSEVSTQENINHLNNSLGKVLICSLLDNNEANRSEKKQTDFILHSVDSVNNQNKNENQIIFSTLGISGFSKLSLKEDLSKMKIVIQELLKKINQSHVNQNLVISDVNEVNEIKNVNNANHSIENLGLELQNKIKRLEAKSFIFDKLIVNILEVLRFLTGFNFKENQKMKFQADFNQIINLYNQFTDNAKEKYLVSINCKSGKDRTGVMQQIFSIQSLHENAVSDEKIEKNAIKQLVKKGEHIEYINGSIYGGNTASSKGVLVHINQIIDPEFRDYFGDNFFAETAGNGKISFKKQNDNNYMISNSEVVSHKSLQI